MDEEIDFSDIVNNHLNMKQKTIGISVADGMTYTERSPEMMIENAEIFLEGREQAERQAAEARLNNAYAFSNSMGYTLEEAYAAEPEIRRNLYQGEKVSSETLSGRLQIEYDKKKSEVEIAFLRFQQLYGDTSPGTVERIQDIRAGMPQYSRLEELSQNILGPDSTIAEKIFASFGAIPYVFASQLPMWIEQGKYGAITGSVAAIYGAATGGIPGALAAGGKGFLLGGGLVEMAMEAGMMTDDIMTEAELKGIEVDPTIIRRQLMHASAAIAALDMGSFGSILSRVAKKPTTKLITDVIKAGWLRSALSEGLKQGLLGGAQEGVTEFAQEMIGGLAGSWAIAELEQEGIEGLTRPEIREMFEESALALALAAPMGFFMSGGGGFISGSRSYVSGKRKIAQAAVDSKAVNDAIRTDEESRAISNGDVEVDFADGEETVVTLDEELTTVETEVVQTPLGPQQKPVPAPPPPKSAPVAILRPDGEINVTEGVPVGDFSIHGRTKAADGSTLVFVKTENGMEKMTLTQASELTGRAERTLLDKARKAEKDIVNVEEFYGMEPRETPGATLTEMYDKFSNVLERMQQDAVAILDETGTVRMVFTERQARTVLEGNGSEVIGIIEQDGTNIIADLTTVVGIKGWNTAFTMVDGNFANTTKETAVRKAQQTLNRLKATYDEKVEARDSAEVLYQSAQKKKDNPDLAHFKDKYIALKKEVDGITKDMAEVSEAVREAENLREVEEVPSSKIEEGMRRIIAEAAAERQADSAGHEAISGTSEQTTEELAETVEIASKKNMKLDPREDSMPAGLQEAHRIDYKGQLVRSAADLAALFAAFRSQTVETAHIVFVKGDQIVGKNTVSSGRKTHTLWYDGNKRTDLTAIRDLESQAEALGADGFYLVHNHPSGNPRFSQADTRLHMTMRTVSQIYRGGVITNGTQFAYQMRDDLDHTIEKIGLGELSHEAVVEISKDRGTAAFILTDNRQVAAVITLTEETSNVDLERAVKAYGGKEAFITTTSKDGFDTWEDRMTIEDSPISRVAQLEEDGVFNSEAKNPAPEFETSPRLSPLMDSEKGPIPRTVKAFTKFWNNFVNKYNIKRPQGLSVNGSGEHSFNVKSADGKIAINAKADNIDGTPSVRLKVDQLRRGGESFEVLLSVTQDQEGVGVGIKPEQELTPEQDFLVRRYMGEIADKLYYEGTDYSAKDLNLPAEIKELIDNYSQFKNEWKLSPILEQKGNIDVLKDAIVKLSNLIAKLDEQGMQSTAEFQALTTLVWEMGQNRVELGGMAAMGINKLKKRAATLARSVLTPSRLQAVIKGKIGDDFRVRLPLTKKEQIRYDKLKDMSEKQLAKEHKGAEDLAYYNMPGIEVLSYNQLKELSDSLQLFDDLRLKATMGNFNGHKVALNVMISNGIGELNKYRPDEPKGINPSEMAKRGNIYRRAASFMREFMLDRQTQFFYLTEHIAGKSSYVNYLLNRNLQIADDKARRRKQRYVDEMKVELDNAGITQQALSVWEKETMTAGGKEWTWGQALEIYMHYQAEENNKSLTEKGMVFTDKEGVRTTLNPEVVKFEEVAKAVADDRIGREMGKILRKMYDDLGDSIKTTYESVFGKDFPFVGTYYPMKAAEVAYQFGNEEVGKAGGPVVSEFLIKEHNETRISLAKAMLIERSGETHALQLQGSALETWNISMEQGSKFIHMELPFFQASKLLYDPDFRQAMYNKKNIGEKGWRLIETGLQDWAGRRMDVKSTWDQVFMFARRQATRASLGINPFSALKASISYFYVSRYVDMRHTSSGMAAYLKDPKGLVKKYMKLSPQFRDRVMGGALPEVHDIMAGRGAIFNDDGSMKKRYIVPGDYQKSIDNILFGPITTVDKYTVTAVMEAAFQQAMTAMQEGNLTENMKLAMNMDESIINTLSADEKVQAAVAYGDYVMQRTQPDFRPQSRNQFQRGTPIERLASVYGSFVTVSHNMFMDLAHRIKYEGFDAVGIKDTAVVLATAMVVSMGAEGVDVLKNLILGRDQRDWWEMVIRGSEINNIFIARDIASLFTSKVKYGEFAGRGGADSYTRFVDQIVSGAVGTVAGALDGNDRRMVRGIGQMAEGISSLSGMPVVVFEYGFEAIDNAMD